MISTLKERLELAMQGPPTVTQADLARACGVKPPSVSAWITGDTLTIKGENLLKASLALGVNPMWLASGKGPMRPAADDNDAGVSGYDATRHILDTSLLKRVPVVGTASLGFDGYWVDLEYPVGYGDGYFDFPTEDPRAYVLQVRGGSMHPAIRSGWYVVVEPSKQIQMGEFVMVKLADGRSTVKEFLWHRDGEYVLNAVATNERLIVPEYEIELIHHIGGILPPSGRRV